MIARYALRACAVAALVCGGLAIGALTGSASTQSAQTTTANTGEPNGTPLPGGKATTTTRGSGGGTTTTNNGEPVGTPAPTKKPTTVHRSSGAGAKVTNNGEPTSAKNPPRAQKVIVLAGKPSEFTFKLSRSMVAPGKVAFTVGNTGKLSHDFELCTGTLRKLVNSCRGKTSATIAPGKATTLTLTVSKGRHEYLCTVPGHAAAGMKGVLGVGVQPPSTAPE